MGSKHDRGEDQRAQNVLPVAFVHFIAACNIVKLETPRIQMLNMLRSFSALPFFVLYLIHGREASQTVF